jgi:hypothetical protein
MSGYFRATRNVELSVIYYLETAIANDWTGVSVVKSFTNAYKTALPVVCIRLLDTVNGRLEVGADTLLNDYTITIDIFAKSDGQRLDLADYIMDKLKDGCIHYTHSQTPGDTDTLTRVTDGRLHINRFSSNTRIDFGDTGDVDEYDRFRHFIMVDMRKE